MAAISVPLSDSCSAVDAVEYCAKLLEESESRVKVVSMIKGQMDERYLYRYFSLLIILFLFLSLIAS